MSSPDPGSVRYYFLTTDDKVLKKSDIIEEINIVDPFGFMKEVSL